MTDRWDAHPFSDERTAWNFGSKIAPNFEVVEFFNGNPFTLHQTYNVTPGTYQKVKLVNGLSYGARTPGTVTSTTPTIGFATPMRNGITRYDLVGTTGAIIGAENKLSDLY